MERNLKKKSLVDVFYVVKLFLFLNIVEVSLISLKMTKFSPLLTRPHRLPVVAVLKCITV